MRGLDLADVMIDLDQGPLEVEVMEEVKERIAMMMIAMKELKSEGIVKRNVNESIIL